MRRFGPDCLGPTFSVAERLHGSHMQGRAARYRSVRRIIGTSPATPCGRTNARVTAHKKYFFALLAARSARVVALIFAHTSAVRRRSGPPLAIVVESIFLPHPN
jgi:hypothetical protein